MTTTYIRESSNFDTILYPDAMTQITPLSTANVAKYKVTSGGSKSGHRSQNNKTIQLTFWVSRHPINREKENNVLNGKVGKERQSVCSEIIKKWDSNNTILDIFREGEIFSKYQIVSWSHTYQESGDAMQYNLTLEEVREANSLESVILRMDDVKQKDAKQTTVAKEQQEGYVASADLFYFSQQQQQP
ncbi:hypothetical protein NRI82_004158 [Vibrio vulnificus]|nr:hypothetical protein [Vibrio vulnificus]